jgi:hypothetical protein
MKSLKILVIAMSVLIVIGLGLVGYGLSRKAPRPAPAAMPGPTETASFFATRYPLPAGTRLEQAFAAGDRVVLRLSGAQGDKLVLLDSHTGQLAGTIDLTEENK